MKDYLTNISAVANFESGRNAVNERGESPNAYSQSISQLATKQIAKPNNSNTNSPLDITKQNQVDTVSISNQASEQLAKERKALGQEIAEKLYEINEQESAKQSQDSKDPLDKLIAQIKEQIKEVQRQLQALQQDKSEQAEKQREQLNGQLIELNAQLLAIFEQKMQGMKQS